MVDFCFVVILYLFMRKLLFSLLLVSVGFCLFGQSRGYMLQSLVGEKTSSGVVIIKTWDEALGGNYGNRFVLVGVYQREVLNEQRANNQTMMQFASPSTRRSFNLLEDMYEKGIAIYDGRAFEGASGLFLLGPVQRMFTEDEQIEGIKSINDPVSAAIVVVVEVCQRDYSLYGMTLPMEKSLKMVAFISVGSWNEYCKTLDLSGMNRQEQIDIIFNPDGWAEFLKSKQ